MASEDGPAECFQSALRVIAGERVWSHRVDQRKMISIVVHPLETDVRIDARGFSVWYPFTRKPFRYFPSLAAPVLGVILDFASARPPCAFRVEVAALSKKCLAVPSTARWLWVEASEDAVLVFSREAKDGEAIPAKPPSLTPWSPARKMVATFAGSFPCPHCSESVHEGRVFDDFIVCLRCGRSLNVSSHVLRSARIAEVK